MYGVEPILSGLETLKQSMNSNFHNNLRLQYTMTIMRWLGLWMVKLAVLTFFWSSVAAIAACLPSFRPFFSHRKG